MIPSQVLRYASNLESIGPGNGLIGTICKGALLCGCIGAINDLLLAMWLIVVGKTPLLLACIDQVNHLKKQARSTKSIRKANTTI